MYWQLNQTHISRSTIYYERQTWNSGRDYTLFLKTLYCRKYNTERRRSSYPPSVSQSPGWSPSVPPGFSRSKFLTDMDLKIKIYLLHLRIFFNINIQTMLKFPWMFNKCDFLIVYLNQDADKVHIWGSRGSSEPLSHPCALWSSPGSVAGSLPTGSMAFLSLLYAACKQIRRLCRLRKDCWQTASGVSWRRGRGVVTAGVMLRAETVNSLGVAARCHSDLIILLHVKAGKHP